MRPPPAGPTSRASVLQTARPQSTPSFGSCASNGVRAANPHVRSGKSAGWSALDPIGRFSVAHPFYESCGKGGLPRASLFVFINFTRTPSQAPFFRASVVLHQPRLLRRKRRRRHPINRLTAELYHDGNSFQPNTQALRIVCSG